MKRSFYPPKWLNFIAAAFVVSTPFSNVLAKTITLAWDPSPDADVIGYALYATDDGGATMSRFVIENGLANSPIEVTEGKTYTFFTTALTDPTHESIPSNLLIFTVPIANGGGSLLKNPSFESGLSGWAAGGNFSLDNTAASDGSSSIRFNPNNLAANSILLQHFATVPGQTYVVEFDLGVASSFQVQPGVLASIKGSTLLAAQMFAFAPLGTDVTWTSALFGFTADNDSATIMFQDFFTDVPGVELYLDNVRVTAED